MKDKLYDLTERLNALCEAYDPYGWNDYCYDLGGDDVAFIENEELIMTNDPALYDYLNDIIEEDERPEIVSEAIAIKKELIAMHTRPEDRDKPMTKEAILRFIANNSEYKAWQWMLKDYRKSTFEKALEIYLNESHKAAKRYLIASNKYPERMYS